jgi:release factor glutamine methyltransferase
MKTYEECMKECVQQLSEQHIDNAYGDAWALLSLVTGWSRAEYLMKQKLPMDDIQQERFLELIQRRAKHIPLQYITGVQHFYGYEFKVTPDVLIPRYDTEILIEKILEMKQPFKKVLDLCTGSGCIAITLAKELQTTGCVAADISMEALQVANENAKNLETSVTFLYGDLYEPVKENQLGNFDLIVSNPPYIPSAVCEELMEEVRVHEPRLALDGKEDGLYFYRKIIAEAGLFLKDQGYLFLEIGHDQGLPVKEMLQEQGFQEVEIHQDLAGLDRVVCGKWTGDIER